jgi:hypothetical protein
VLLIAPTELRRKRYTQSARERSRAASVLLEVVLALALFIGAATVISAGISASVDAVHRVRLQTHAANLAISIMSELKIGARPLAAVGPENLETPFDAWLYRVNLNASDTAVSETDSTRAVEVIVWHTEENVVHRVTQLFRASEFDATQEVIP